MIHSIKKERWFGMAKTYTRNEAIELVNTDNEQFPAQGYALFEVLQRGRILLSLEEVLAAIGQRLPHHLPVAEMQVDGDATFAAGEGFLRPLPSGFIYFDQIGHRSNVEPLGPKSLKNRQCERVE